MTDRRLHSALRKFEFTEAFVEIGWNHLDQRPPGVEVDGHLHTLEPIAEKKGAQVFVVSPDADGFIPPREVRRKIDRKIARYAAERLLIFIDRATTKQLWLWVDRARGKAPAYREHEWHRSQDPEGLVQKLRQLAFAVEEEDTLTVVDVAAKMERAFDKEQVTKKFYREFDRHRKAFLGEISGIPDKPEREWYASALLNRLMFVYFLQRKGFLDGDPSYLQHRLVRCRERFGDDEFYSFYRTFLLKLFHDGLGAPVSRRDVEVRALIGDVPYLNGGLFQIHDIERDYPDIEIPDDAFVALFGFFDAWDWTLDYRPLRQGNEINPDVLGYLFEQYINQKQMGAYYTKEDITGYITRNTLLPFVLDEARRRHPHGFRGEDAVWRLLQQDPDAYIYPAVQHTKRDESGRPLPLPDEIAAGLADVAKRDAWNTLTPREWRLPTEIWRETVARRRRYEELRSKLAAGEVHQTADLVSLNLDVEQFTRDAIETCESPDLLRGFWKALRGVTVLDPTCGSGAFLFAALERLETLYTACLHRMQEFVGRLDTDPDANPQALSDFRAELTEAYDQSKHPNLTYFVLKRILLDNLYGVDIMPEAVEICKLRLFLKLASQVQPGGRLEPLPDIDFNIRAGNTLVGYARRDEVRHGLTSSRVADGVRQDELVFADRADALAAFEERLKDVAELAERFREQQQTHGGEVTREDKEELRTRLGALTEQLDRALALEGGVKTGTPLVFERWRESHQPFHWFAEFYGVMSQGGFDVVIGNPPYLEHTQVDYTINGYDTEDSRAVHVWCVERSLALCKSSGTLSMILPMSVVSTQRMAAMQQMVESGRDVWYANYSWRPGKLFDQVNRALTILVALPSDAPSTYSTTYQKWTSATREGLIDRLSYEEVPHDRNVPWAPKISDPVEASILRKIMEVPTVLAGLKGKRSSPHRVFYRTTGGLYWKVFTDFAPAFNVKGVAGHSTRETKYPLREARWIRPVIGILSSGVYWWWYIVTSNCRDLNPFDLDNFPVPLSALDDPALRRLSDEYLEDIDENSTMLVRNQKRTGRTETQSFKIQKSKPTIEKIDAVLAKHYGFTNEELDFIVNYDIKYRLGVDAFEEDEA
jgi:hypothetical protein